MLSFIISFISLSDLRCLQRLQNIRNPQVPLTKAISTHPRPDLFTTIIEAVYRRQLHDVYKVSVLYYNMDSNDQQLFGKWRALHLRLDLFNICCTSCTQTVLYIRRSYFKPFCSHDDVHTNTNCTSRRCSCRLKKYVFFSIRPCSSSSFGDKDDHIMRFNLYS